MTAQKYAMASAGAETAGAAGCDRNAGRFAVHLDNSTGIGRETGFISVLVKGTVFMPDDTIGTRGTWNRRQFLKLTSVGVTATALAGCSGNGSDGGDGDSGSNGSGGDGGDGGSDGSGGDGGGGTATTTGNSYSEMSLRLGTSTPEDSVQGTFANRFAEQVNEETNGKVTIERFFNNQLGSTVEQANSVKTGSIDMAVVPLSPLFSDFAVFGYPYIYEDYDHLLKATNPETSPPMNDLLDRVASEANVRFLSMTILGTRHLGLTDVEACTPADLEEVDVRSPQLELFTKTIEGLGASPTNLDISELISSMSSGAVDGWENTVNTMEAFGVQDVQNYVIETEHMRFPVPMYMNLDVWTDMSSATQEVVKRAANDAAAWNASEIAEIEAEAKTKLKDAGMTFVTADGCLDREAFRTACRETVDEAFPEWASIAEEIEQLA